MIQLKGSVVGKSYPILDRAYTAEGLTWEVLLVDRISEELRGWKKRGKGCGSRLESLIWAVTHVIHEQTDMQRVSG